MRRKARRGTTTLTAAACVLAASSSTSPVVEAFGQRRPAALPPISLRQQQPARAARISATSITTVKSHRRTTSLGYREGDDDRSAAQRLQHRRAISPPTPSTTPTSTTSRQIPAQDVPPKLSESQKRPTGGGGGGGLLGLLSRGRRRITARNHHTEAEQFVLDEYLEFLDKRYRRMHGAEELAQKAGDKKTLAPASRKSAGPPTNTNGSSSSRRNREGISTTMDWLNANDHDAANANGGDSCGCDAACQEQKRLDALEVLGLAGLASAELLRKHQLPVPEDEMVAPIAAASSSTSSSSSSRTTSSGIMSARNGSTAASIIDVRPTTRKHPQPTVQHRLTYVTTVTALAVRSIVTKTVTSTVLYTKAVVSTLPNRVGHAAGGRGRHTVRMATALVLAALCAVVRPLGLLALKVGGQN